jgi:hypothetical protein
MTSAYSTRRDTDHSCKDWMGVVRTIFVTEGQTDGRMVVLTRPTLWGYYFELLLIIDIFNPEVQFQTPELQFVRNEPIPVMSSCT